MAKKTWQQKFETSKVPQIEVLDKPMLGTPAGKRLLISTPREIDDLIRAIPEGKSREVDDLKEELAAKHDADAVCPLTTGIFLRIITELALENHRSGAPVNEISPFWRVLDSKSKTAKKVEGAAEFIEAQRSAENIG